jgi:hypothetical protein
MSATWSGCKASTASMASTASTASIASTLSASFPTFEALQATAIKLCRLVRLVLGADTSACYSGSGCTSRGSCRATQASAIQSCCRHRARGAATASDWRARGLPWLLLDDVLFAGGNSHQVNELVLVMCCSEASYLLLLPAQRNTTTEE